MVRLENEWLSIGFDPSTGSLVSLRSKPAGREFIRPRPQGSGNPFGIWTDFFAPYRFVFDENAYKGVFHSSKVLPPDPRQIAHTRMQPTEGVKVEVDESRLSLGWRINGLEIRVTVSLDGCRSRWAMTIANRGTSRQSILPVFPWIDGISLSGETGRMVALSQAGYIADLWAHQGGAYGNCFHSSAQFGCLFEEDTGDALGFYVEDGSFGAKDIRYVKPSIQVRWFPPRDLGAGQSIALPETVILAYRGSWKQTAAAYGDWFRKTARPDPTAEWILSNAGYTGAWVEKKGRPYGVPALGTAMESLEELPVGHISNTAETIEYAFYCAGSMKQVTGADGKPFGSPPYRHTDGWNTVRPDLGGMEALKVGVDRLHRNRKRVALYVEGLIVPEESELFEHIADARRWLVTNPDGGNFGPYTGTKFVHMCPGCVEWQDHLAAMIARLVRESGVDGIRIDSLNFYFWPCYNAAHDHASPFDYNLWVQQLYAKVADAAKAIRPDILLAVEGPSDFVNLRFNLALHQMVGDQMEHLARDTAPLRVALPDFVVVQWTGGGVAQSLRLLPDGTGHAGDSESARLAAKWFPVHQAVKRTLSRGNVATPNPVSSSADMHCRWIQAETEDLVIGVRPEPTHREHDPVLLKRDTVCSTVTLPLGYAPSELYLYDIEKQTSVRVPYTHDHRGISFDTTTNWFVAVAYRQGGDRPMLLTGEGEVKRGGEISLLVDAPTAEGRLEVWVEPVGMAGAQGTRASTNAVATIAVPSGSQTGYYWVTARGRGLRDTARTIRVVD